MTVDKSVALLVPPSGDVGMEGCLGGGGADSRGRDEGGGSRGCRLGEGGRCRPPHVGGNLQVVRAGRIKIGIRISR